MAKDSLFEVSHCCGLSLKHGTIIVGIVQAIFAFMFLILSAAYAEHPTELIDMTDPAILPAVPTLKTVLIIIAVFSALLCVFSILIIFGAETNRPLLLIPWLLTNPITVFVYIISTLLAIINHTGADSTLYIIGHLGLGAILSLIVSYNIAVVYSFYKHLKSLNF